EVVPGNDGPGGRDPRPGHVETYEGGYAAYVLQRAERERQSALAAEKRTNMLRKELAWLRRGAPARTSKPRFRIDAAEALIADEPAPRDTMELTKMATSRLGKKVIDLENITFAYPGGAAQPILRNVTLRLAPGERLGIMGPNGAGKSSLLGVISGALEPQSGHVKRGKTVKLAVLDQDTRDLEKVSEKRVVEAVSDIAMRVNVGTKEITATQLVERMGFTRERAWTRVAEISGGERRRLQLMRLLMAEPNVLLLDEPTNDLDTDTLAAVEDLLDSWPGTLVVVSHDRYLLERLTDRQMAVLDQDVRDLPGGIDQYLALRADKGDDGGPSHNATSSNSDTAQGEPSGPSRFARSREAQKEAGRIERKLNKARSQLDKLHARQATESESGDFEALAATSREASALESQIADLEEAWLEAAEEAEELRA
ncbi:MAG: ABC-F family ATP-binding cassette domain-containing protein, partial [Ancrocorticia sp.]|uniref:ABC-F family ATP-binding cassette domain-containing protein n=1 Tax=Ancrocorticia sp. TaxID=2593684 RepID=UPI003F927111